jgi:alanine racemase
VQVLRALARVNLAAVERNCAHLAAVAAPAALCAVVKADGYGHGAAPVARAALAGGASRLAVATAQEAAALRRAGVDAPLLVLGPLSDEELPVALGAGADVVAWRAGFPARIAAAAAGTVGVHVKLDSGMGRFGTRDPAEADAVVAAVAATPGLRLAGVMTHFATADSDPGFMREQLGRFVPWADRVAAAHPGVLRHAANSAATLAEPAARLDCVRCGIAVYGLDPFNADPAAQGLEPALELFSYVAEVKRAEPGESCGYGRAFIATEPRWIGSVPIGYADGVRRALTNNADVLVDGRRVALVGTVSMDTITVDLGPAVDGEPEPPLRGAPAVLIGASGGERILAEHVAHRLKTINYEVTCGISARVPRAYHNDGAPVPGAPG